MNFYETFHAQMVETAKGAIVKEVEELTEEEKFSIAFLAGVPMAKPTGPMCCDMKLRFRTVPCGITKIDGKFHVHHRAEDA